jgi:phospholipid/cholesterol/gamma-HCH transport system ATP-binding protein
MTKNKNVNSLSEKKTSTRKLLNKETGNKDAVNKEHVKISLTNVSKSFASKQVLCGINLDIFAGKSLVIIGGSGSGKSVLLKSIVGLIQPSDGVIKLDGKDVSEFSAQQRSQMMNKFGVLFQGGALFDSLPVWRNISFSLMQTKNISKAEAYDLAISKLASVGLSGEVANLFPSELSGGMQKRVALARAIAHDPEVIFFDEPTTGLDPIMADIINDLIVECSKKLGATTFTITHDMRSAKKIADKVAMIYEGKIIWHDNVDNMEKTDNEYVRQFIKGSAKGPIKMKIQDH